GVYAVPYVVEGYGIIYNEEITDKYFKLSNRKTDIGSMKEVKNFETLKAVVEDMTANKDSLGIQGVFASTSLSSGEDWRWQTHLLNVPMYYELRDSEEYSDPTIAGLNSKEIAFRYGDNYRNLFDLYTNNSITKKTLLGSKSTADSMAEFATGQVAMVQNGNWAWSQIKDVAGNKVDKDKIKFLPLYSGIDGEENQGLCIGTENYLAINKNSSKEAQKASLDFLNWLFSSDTGKEYVTDKLDFITPFNTFDEDELPEDPLAKEVVRYMRDEELTTVPWVFTSFPSDTFKTTVGSALLDYVQGDKKWEQVRKAVKDTWKSEQSK
ncbi:MAG: carbohydrate ABC transporter substrate-binding protein, partial [Clostridia bacterium]|nr:carbohydrate ABC transporter substrate-binding protein [Clostridia bacterium]